MSRNRSPTRDSTIIWHQELATDSLVVRHLGRHDHLPCNTNLMLLLLLKHDIEWAHHLLYGAGSLAMLRG